MHAKWSNEAENSTSKQKENFEKLKIFLPYKNYNAEWTSNHSGYLQNWTKLNTTDCLQNSSTGEVHQLLFQLYEAICKCFKNLK